MAETRDQQILTFRKKPVEIKAIRWNGGDYEILETFCGFNWGRADAKLDSGWPSDIQDDEQVVVFNSIERTWLPVPVGWWIIRGVRGELYPCDNMIMDETYEPIEG